MKKFIKVFGIIFIIIHSLSLLGISTPSKIQGGWTYYSSASSLVGILIGLILIIISKRYINETSYFIEYSICPKCEESYTYINLKDGICPKCDIKTIDIEEYYN